MDEDDKHDLRRSASEDGGHPGEGLGQAGTMLARRLAAATRTVSRIDERLRAEENVRLNSFGLSQRWFHVVRD